TRPRTGRHRTPNRLTTLRRADVESGKAAAALAASGGLLAVAILAAAAARPDASDAGAAMATTVTSTRGTGSALDADLERPRSAARPAVATAQPAEPADEPARAVA